MKIFECSHCGNQTFMLRSSGVVMVCCGDPMQELVAGSKDAALEKHVPAVTVNNNQLSVVIGEVVHPMTEAHYIQWIGVEQEGNTQFVKLTPSDEPKATFTIEAEKDFTVYEYCNLHGLWKK